MNIKTDLIKKHIAECIVNQIDDFDIDEAMAVDSKAIQILSEIQQILKNEDYDDFEAVDKIVGIFCANGIDSGSRHDF